MRKPAWSEQQGCLNPGGLTSSHHMLQMQEVQGLMCSAGFPSPFLLEWECSNCYWILKYVVVVVVFSVLWEAHSYEYVLNLFRCFGLVFLSNIWDC